MASGADRPTVFISHVHEDRNVAAWLQQELEESFLGGFGVFVSSERHGHAGEDWLEKIEEELKRSSVLIALCSPVSVERPWVNFEPGAAWMQGKRIIPLCHGGLRPGDLENPLSTLHGIAIDDPDDLETLYETLVAQFGFARMPSVDFQALVRDVPTGDDSVDQPGADSEDMSAAVSRRLRRALTDRQKWRTIGALATEAGIDEDTVMDVLRPWDDVRFGTGKSGKRIAGLVERVGR
jgi:hypothetical protein